MLNPHCILHLEPDTPVETLDTGKKHYPECIALNGLKKLSGDDVPPRFDVDELYDGRMATTHVLMPVSGVQTIFWIEQH